MKPKKEHYKVIILGTGPAGLTAAIYTSRAMLEPLMVEGPSPGGLLMFTTDVENYPGFADGIMGPELMMTTKAQAERFGTEVLLANCERVDLSQRPIRLWLDGSEVTCDALIAATGAEARWLGIESEQHYRKLGGGVSACAVCDGAFFRNVPVAVVGGGDSAMEEAHFLTKYASQVYVIHRRDTLRASRIMQERALKNPKIKFIWDSEVSEVLGNGKLVNGIKLKNLKTGEESTLEVEGLFLAIGHIPNTQIFEGQLELDADGYIVTPKSSMETSVPGVFAAGDVQDTDYKQAITAAASGCMAAMDAEAYLESLEDGEGAA